MSRSELENTFCYKSTLGEFKKESIKHFTSTMINAFLNIQGVKPEPELVSSWEDCFKVLQVQIQILDSSYNDLVIFFEYVLPYENKRADVIIVGDKNVCLFEFKKYDKESFWRVPDYQLKDYYRLLSEYHLGACKMVIHPAAVFTKASQMYSESVWTNNNVKFLKISPQYISKFIKSSFYEDIKIPVYLNKWIDKQNF